ncbi:prephenate dehydratase [Ureibacillus aquaedulcis]|uniref:Prephenate dehydratase n=1 Tax=Ureibacillus aquaedulcis TaxID=3058421 RepID=A0ABT8GT16_9BACL|nr:prephenate dehydratase [Ureibacillus sp. BA0131]MDN4494552.1 prephenate dehydratase [Ureibacillus sp. BA0131]
MKNDEAKQQIAYLGPEASFTYLATKSLFPSDDLLPFSTIPECIEAVSEEKVNLAVVPLENTIEGTVPLTIDYLYHEANLFIVADCLSKIQQHLMVHKNQKDNWEKIEEIYSHPHALAQCHKYLYYRFSSVPLNRYSSTSAAAKLVSENPDRCIAAIGNSSSAEKYDLEIVQRNVHDFQFNHTRFLVLSKKNMRLPIEKSEGNAKTTLMITLPLNVSGALHQVLSVLAWRKLDLSKIESRPLKTGLGEYFFIMDVHADENDAMMKGAMEELAALGCSVKSLGTYYTYLTQE